MQLQEDASYGDLFCFMYRRRRDDQQLLPLCLGNNSIVSSAIGMHILKTAR